MLLRNGYWLHICNIYFLVACFDKIYCHKSWFIKTYNTGFLKLSDRFFDPYPALLLSLSSLTPLGPDKMVAIEQTIFSKAFYWMKLFYFDTNFTEAVSNHPRVHTSSSVQVTDWFRTDNKPLPEPRVTHYTPCGLNKPQQLTSGLWKQKTIPQCDVYMQCYKLKNIHLV